MRVDIKSPEVEVVGVEPVEEKERELEKAKVVVGVGRGMKNLNQVEELANDLKEIIPVIIRSL